VARLRRNEAIFGRSPRHAGSVSRQLQAERRIIPLFQEQYRTQRLIALCSDISGIKTSAATLARRRPS
jgi:hypothetical protein